MISKYFPMIVVGIVSLSYLYVVHNFLSVLNLYSELKLVIPLYGIGFCLLGISIYLSKQFAEQNEGRKF